MTRRLFVAVGLVALPLVLLWVLATQLSWHPEIIASKKELRGYITALAWSPDGKQIAYSTKGGINTGATQWGIMLFSTKTRKVSRTIAVAESHGEDVRGLSFASDGRFLLVDFASRQRKQHVGVWNLATGESKFTSYVDGFVTALPTNQFKAWKLGRSGSVTGIGTWDAQTLRQRDVISATLPTGFLPEDGPPFDAFASRYGSSLVIPKKLLSPQGQYAVLSLRRPKTTPPGVVGSPGALLVFDAATGRHIKILNANLNEWSLFPLAFAPNGRYLLVGSALGLRLHDLQTGNSQSLSLDRGQGVHLARFSPDSTRLAVAQQYPDSGSFGRVDLYETRTGQWLRTLKHSINAGPGAIAFSPDSRSLATGSSGRIRIWHVR